MAAIPLCEAALAELKKSLLDDFDDVKSSHITEALAASMGFRTHAALKAAMTGPEPDRAFYLLDSSRFLARLVDFGYRIDPKTSDFDFELWHVGKVVVSTVPESAYEIEYKTARQKAWRNLMVLTINVALERKLFTLRPGDNRLAGPDIGGGALFDFTLPSGLPVRGYVSDAGSHELNIHAAVNPIGNGVRAGNASFAAGDAVALGWLERERGAWLQSSDTRFHCRNALLSQLAAMHVEPHGFGDRGRVIL
ncbi:MAG: hypothetical protein LW854_20865 [Rubrivivax sp.]|jgi:hypothetical protein|nr:hypothetical protein [Rubrivivax sp.]